MTSFALEPIYGSLLLALVALIATFAVILTVTPPTPDPRHRRLLISLRMAAAMVLLLTAFRPALLRTDNRPADAALIVAVDTSRSMTLPDGDRGTRWTTQVEAWRQLAAGLDQLDATLVVRLLAYDAVARKLPATDPTALDDETPQGELTDLSAAALASIQAAEGQPIAGVVLMGDGTQTAPLQDAGAQRVVETLRALGVPLWTVPIGPAGGASASRDVAVDALTESYRLFAGNQVDIEFQLLIRGLANVEVPVRMSWIDSQGKATEIASRTVVPSNSSETLAMSLPVVAPAPGTYRLKVEADTQAGELVTNNNTQIAFVDVREGGGRILFLEGSLRPEQMFVRRSLRRFPDLDLTFKPILDDTAAAWPVDLQDWLQPGKFDIYILGDLDAAALGDAQLESLAAAVSGGAALVTLGGYLAYGAGGYASSPLSEVLPVPMDDNRRSSSEAADSADQIPGPLSVRMVRNHPITDLGGEDPAATWQRLPALSGANRLLGPKVAPGVLVLLETPAGDPLLVIGQYGQGRTAALAIDSTYRWWRSGDQEAHRRFWRQLILWLLAREDASGDKIVIEMDDRRLAVSESTEFRASLETIGDNWDATQLSAEIVDEAGGLTPLPVSREQRGEASAESPPLAIRGTLGGLGPGFYRLRVSSTSGAGSPQPEEMAFQVVDESRELAKPMADPVYLRQLAELTVDHGGAAFTPDEIQSLVETIRQRRRQAESPIVEKYRLGDGPVSGWTLFLVFASALSTEWFLRRRWGLA
jgi:hypothetical protein